MLFGKYINKYYLKYLYILIIGTMALVLVDYVQLFIPELYQMVINGINEGFVTYKGARTEFNMTFLLDHICLPMIFIIISMVVGRFIWRICFFGSAIRVETDLRGRMFNHCKELSQQFYQNNKVGAMMSLFTNDLETVQDCFGSGILMMFDALFLGIMAVYKMFRMDALLTMFSMIPLLFLLIAGLIVGKYIEKKWKMRQESFAALSDFSQESFAGIAVIKAFVKEGIELSRFRKLNKDNEKTNIEYTKLSVKLNISVNLFVESVICIIIGYGGYLVYKDVFNAGQLIEFIGYFSSTVWPVMAVSQLIDMTSRGKASLARITALLDEKVDVKDSNNVVDCGMLKGNIEVRNLTFRYPGSDYDALHDLSFKINAGENVGIIGKVGAGKTTIVDLILRTYNVPDGTLFLDSHDMNTIPIQTVRANAAYVPQDNFLFSDTIENNIAFATDGGSSEDTRTAAKYSDIHDNIMGFADGYNTILGERGVTVSGGQKQRISIARALMKNAPILILDDSVSAVDVKTEKKILENLSELRKGRTTILIAHRISTVEHMDKIIFMEDGHLIASGSHNELYKSCEEYRKMVELQKLDDADDNGGNSNENA